ncbi:cytochrome oxidase putative small subunit CydP [Acinetobacter sp. A47]|uniref:cytochrome oxidase putative small subunit CydP n=1 Tax=Acinetobacter sp. A47 TaxID=1561217 RepID=UPI00056E3360|nr:cytochrome oxidase putative small subunit CydP [Acinetobacter sp. A47]
MNTSSHDPNRRLIREITIILIIKVALLMVIKHIWFDAPTIPKDFNNEVAERIAGDMSKTQETR